MNISTNCLLPLFSSQWAFSYQYITVLNKILWVPTKQKPDVKKKEKKRRKKGISQNWWTGIIIIGAGNQEPQSCPEIKQFILPGITLSLSVSGRGFILLCTHESPLPGSVSPQVSMAAPATVLHIFLEDKPSRIHPACLPSKNYKMLKNCLAHFSTGVYPWVQQPCIRNVRVPLTNTAAKAHSWNSYLFSEMRNLSQAGITENFYNHHQGKPL